MMIRFLRNVFIVAFFAGICMIVFALITYAFFHDRNKNYLAAYSLKVDRLEKTKGQKRIIFIGGSGGAFSLNSEMLKDSLHIEVVNTALHAGIGLNDEVDLFYEFIDKNNDIVIIAPEFETLSNYDPEFLSEEALYTRSLRPFSFPDVKVLLYFLQRNNPVNYMKEIVVSREMTVYHKDNFNEYGDIAHYPVGRQYKMPEYEQGKKLKFNDNLDSAIAFLQEKFKGYNYYIASPVIHPSWDTHSLSRFDSLMTVRFGYRYIAPAKPMASKFSAPLFYNTIYHPNAAGKNVYTAYIAAALRR